MTVQLEYFDDFESFYNAEHVRLVLFLYKQGASWEDAWDFTQHAFVEAYLHWDRIDKPRAWIRVTANRAYRQQKQRGVEDVTRAVRAGWAPQPYWPDFHLTDEAKRVYATIARLPPRQREVMAWFYDGYGIAEIAAQMELSQPAIRSNLYEARKQLKTLLALPPSLRASGRKGGTA